MNELIRADNLGIIRQHRPLFRQLSLVLRSGEGIHLTGENGSGKTTLLQLLAGTIPCSHGEITRHSPLIFLGHRPGVKPQLTVRENLQMAALLYHKMPKTGLAGKLDNAIVQVNLSRFADRQVQTLSAGQQRRVQLARLWLDCPPLWLLDEPLTALDHASSERLYQHCLTHLGSGGGLLITSHQALPFAHAQIREIALDSLSAKPRSESSEA